MVCSIISPASALSGRPLMVRRRQTAVTRSRGFSILPRAAAGSYRTVLYTLQTQLDTRLPGPRRILGLGYLIVPYDIVLSYLDLDRDLEIKQLIYCVPRTCIEPRGRLRSTSNVLLTSTASAILETFKLAGNTWLVMGYRMAIYANGRSLLKEMSFICSQLPPS
jgi:hypothetical protein